MKYFGFGVLVVGAVIVYLSKFIVKSLRKLENRDEVTDKDNLYCKLTGLIVAVLGTILTLI